MQPNLLNLPKFANPNIAPLLAPALPFMRSISYSAEQQDKFTLEFYFTPDEKDIMDEVICPYDFVTDLQTTSDISVMRNPFNNLVTSTGVQGYKATMIIIDIPPPKK